MNSQRGFTLLEVIAAMTLVALLMALAYSGLSASTRASVRGEEIVERTNRLRVIHQFLRQQLSGALPLALPVEAGEQDGLERVIFEGEEDYMRFVAPMPGYLGYGGPHEQALYFEDGALYLRFAVLQREADDFFADEVEPVVLLEDVDDVRFSYLTVDEQGEPSDWLDEWDTPASTPLMIRIELEFPEEAMVVWPALDVAPVIDGAVARHLISAPEELRRLPVDQGESEQ